MILNRFSFLFSLFIFILQIIEAGIIRSLQNEINLAQYGFSTLSLALESSLLGITSGILLLFLLPLRHWENKSANGSSRKNLLTILSVSLLPTLLLLYRLLLAFNSPSYSLTQFWGHYKFAVFDWIMYSQIPSIWLGLIVGWMAKMLLAKLKMDFVNNTAN